MSFKNTKILSILIFFVACYPNIIQAEDFIFYGGRSTGMGGAGVASNRGVKNVYWNPARLAMDKKIDISLSAVNLNLEVLGSAVKLFDELQELPDFSVLQASYENGFDPKNPIHVENAQLAFKLLFSDILDFGGDDGLILNETTGVGAHFNVKNNDLVSILSILKSNLSKINLNSFSILKVSSELKFLYGSKSKSTENLSKYPSMEEQVPPLKNIF